MISPAELENDILYLKKHGYTAILMEDLINYTKGGELPEKPILLTFDDGYYNNYLYAFPLAKQYRVKFVISPIGRYADLYSGRDENNAYYSHATWEQLREMTGSGLVEVQNHSYDLHEQKGGALGVRQRQGEYLPLRGRKQEHPGHHKGTGIFGHPHLPGTDKHRQQGPEIPIWPWAVPSGVGDKLQGVF